MMTMNEKKILFAFGCPNRVLTVERLHYAATLAVDSAAKKDFYRLADKLDDEELTDWYRCFYCYMRLEVECMRHHKYLPDDYPIPVDGSGRGYRKHLRKQKECYKRPVK